MSSETIKPGAAAETATARPPIEPSPRPTRPPRVPHLRPWWVRGHRWVALVLGSLLMVQCAAGAVLLMEPELMRVGQGDRFHHTASADPMTAAEALAFVQRERPDLGAVSVARFRGIWTVSGDPKEGDTRTAFVDPGARTINAVGALQPSYLKWLVNLHHCGFGCDDRPGYVSWMDHALIGEMTVASFVVGSLGVALIFLCLTGVILWWPTIRNFASGFTVRRGRGGHVRNLDLHKVVGIVALPFLLMWGVSGANFEFRWIEKVYYFARPGSAPAEAEKPEPGTGPMLTLAQAQDVALERHPDATVVGVRVTEPESDKGSYRFNLREGFDLRKDSYNPGHLRVTVDSHGGEVQESGALEGPLTQRYFEGVQNRLHMGQFVPWVPRLFMAVLFGLAPVLLGLTGLSIRLTRWRKNRDRRRARRLRDERAAAKAAASAGRP
jgi:uncharacterized iron-regulated membrane protein